VFAPGAGRPLVVAAGLLVLGGFVELWHAPFSPPLLALLIVGGASWAFFAGFFRDPERPIGGGIVSAADGKVRAVTVEGERTRISVFMNVTNVHVNRMPLDGMFSRIQSGGAGYRPAYRTDADRNVARTYLIDTALGPVEIVQITGILARRLVSFVKSGEPRRRGERFGMIVLGSRVDVVLPTARVRPTVRVGDRVWAGRSTIAEALA
jgi:phosphatidylserine decarboxylase